MTSKALLPMLPVEPRTATRFVLRWAAAELVEAVVIWLTHTEKTNRQDRQERQEIRRNEMTLACLLSTRGARRGLPD
jgi:hypothetical protein